MTGSLEFKPVQDNPELVSPSVFAAASPEMRVAEIDPAYMGGKELSEHYGTELLAGANCVIVRGKLPEGKGSVTAAVLVQFGSRADLNGIVRERLGAKKVSMALLDEVLAETGMEFGSITPVGLPASYKLLMDSRLMEREHIIVGGGKQISKLLVPTTYFRTLPNAEVLSELAK